VNNVTNIVEAFIGFLRSKKCSIAVKTKDFQIKAEAPTEAQVEKLLKLARNWLEKNRL